MQALARLVESPPWKAAGGVVLIVFGVLIVTDASTVAASFLWVLVFILVALQLVVNFATRKSRLK